jgi:hypothetical protein
MRVMIGVALGLICATNAYAINKCTDASGKVSYQEEPCVSGAKASTIKVWEFPAPIAVGSAPRAVGTNYQQRAKDMEVERKLRSGTQDIEQLQRDVTRYQRDKDDAIQRLKRYWSYYPAPAIQMNNVISYYDGQIQAAQLKILGLQNEAAELRSSAERVGIRDR